MAPPPQWSSCSLFPFSPSQLKYLTEEDFSDHCSQQGSISQGWSHAGVLSGRGEGHPTVLSASLGLLPPDLPIGSGMISIPLLEFLESPPTTAFCLPTSPGGFCSPQRRPNCVICSAWLPCPCVWWWQFAFWSPDSWPSWPRPPPWSLTVWLHTVRQPASPSCWPSGRPVITPAGGLPSSPRAPAAGRQWGSRGAPMCDRGTVRAAETNRVVTAGNKGLDRVAQGAPPSPGCTRRDIAFPWKVREDPFWALWLQSLSEGLLCYNP